MSEAATLKQVMEFFAIPTGQFGKEWKVLSDSEKAQIKAGLGDGSLTY